MAAASALAACGGGGGDTTTAAVPAPAAPRWNAWLCHPANPVNACRSDLATTAVGPGGSVQIHEIRVPQNRPVDCFYVYPTVNGDPDGNADLTVGPPEQQAATVQAARFEQVCRGVRAAVPADDERARQRGPRLPRRPARRGREDAERPRPVVPAYRDPRGLHAADVSIALETLVELVRSQSAAWLAKR